MISAVQVSTMASFPARRLAARVRHHALVAAATGVGLAALLATPLAAQQPALSRAAAATRPLSLEEAITIAERQSETLRIARAGLTRARGQRAQARSGYFPQLSATASYQRQLQNQFAAITDRFGDGSDSEAPPADSGSGGGLADSPITRIFASENTVVLGLNFSQNLWTGGRLSALVRAARAGERAADVEMLAQRAQLQLDVAQSYYDALLANRLVAIAESSLVQTERTLRQAQLARQVGTQSEFDLLRARVTRDNQRPVLIQARTGRDAAYLRLLQLLDLPLDEPLDLTTGIENGLVPVRQLAEAPVTPSPAGQPVQPISLQVDVDDVLAPDPLVRAIVDSVAASTDTVTINRAPVRQAIENVEALDAQFRATRASRFPAVQLQSQYQRFAYPPNQVPGWNDFFPNWTVSFGLSVPLLTGGRIRGEELVAEANLVEGRERLQQAEELAALDARLAIDALEQAAEAFAASQGTSEQANRAYEIAEVRFREGISTQLELDDSRLLLQQSQANRAQAARDLAVAQLRLVLLPNLPLGTVAASAQAGGRGGSMGGVSGGGVGGGGRGGAAPSQGRAANAAGPSTGGVNPGGGQP